MLSSSIECLHTLYSVLMNREDQSQGVVINIYHTDNGLFNISKFVKDMLKKQQKIRFSGDGASHQNGAAECTTNMVVTIIITMLMHAALRCHKDTLSTDFGQWQ